jgi:hypothetical protein
VSPFPLSAWNQSCEFYCPDCGHTEAYISRSRGFFEKLLLPLMMLRPVRCEQCYHRSYVWRSIRARPRGYRLRGDNLSHPPSPSPHDSRVA